MNFESIFAKLKEELLLSETSQEFIGIKDDSNRLELIKKIELIVSEIIERIGKGQAPIFKTITHTKWDNCFYDNRVRMKEVMIKRRKVSFGRPSSRSGFVTIIFLLSKIYKLLTTKATCNRRELYYQNLQLFETQKQVDDGMKDVCHILNSPSWELRVIATSKGIVSGPLVLELANGDCVDCSKIGGVPVPSDVLGIKSISSTATWVLIIEKDTSFQKLVEDKTSAALGTCILITGKGFPDVNTRMLVCKFWEHLQIPILALVDADPYGFEIMCVYRFGSLSMPSYSGYLACPAVRWLGIHPSDIKPLLLDAKELSVRDRRKIRLLLQRRYVEENEKLKTQLNILLEGNVKAEIESVSSISASYLTNFYLYNKIQCKEYY